MASLNRRLLIAQSETLLLLPDIDTALGFVAEEETSDELLEMAQDPALQRELKAIEHEFSGTEAEGLERL